MARGAPQPAAAEGGAPAWIGPKPSQRFLFSVHEL
jgi:hypothetical protein